MTARWLTLFLDRPAGQEPAATRFWPEVTGTVLSGRRGDGGRFATSLPPAGDAHLRVQRVDDGPGGCHLDLHVDEARTTLPDVAARAAALGAEQVRAEPGLVVLHSPGGLPFCLVRWDGERSVPRASGPGPVLADQVCLDIPAEVWDAEALFWAGLTGWPVSPRPLPEFCRLEVPAGHGLHVLLQRRQDSPAGAPVSAHPDLATLDRQAAVAAHTTRGATVVREGPVWTTLEDPTGHPYCLTDRDPATGRPPA